MIKIQDEFFSQDSTVEELYNFFHYAGSWQFDFFKKEYILGNTSKPDVENLISKIIKRKFNFTQLNCKKNFIDKQQISY